MDIFDAMFLDVAYLGFYGFGCFNTEPIFCSGISSSVRFSVQRFSLIYFSV